MAYIFYGVDKDVRRQATNPTRNHFFDNFSQKKKDSTCDFFTTFTLYKFKKDVN
jgi:hypothetical protein